MQDRGDPSAVLKALYPAVDASMITQMRRRQAILLDAISHPTGRKEVGVVVDGQHTRGSTGGVLQITGIKGGRLSFFRVN
jgi:hypothetical protein